MAKYPNSIPVLATLTGSDYPKAEHLNAPNREIEAICLELGINPKTIEDEIPRENPQTVAQYLDMVAYIIHKMHGGANWYSVTPLRVLIGGNGNGGVIGAGGVVYGCFFVGGTSATDAQAQIAVPYGLTVVKYWMNILTAQPGTGALIVGLRKNVVTQDFFAIAAGSAAGAYGSSAVSVSYAAGDRLNILFQNNASSNSAQLGCFSIETQQAG